jgi:hypothetical protein
MKIGIITLPLINNYGGLLQNYALQTYLKRLGHDVVSINCPQVIYKYPKLRFLLSYIKRTFQKYLLKDKRIVFANVNKQILFENTASLKTKEFVERNIKTIEIYGRITKEFCAENKFDAFVVGSDQVWRGNSTPYILNNFLDFTEGSDVIRLAYAASFGVDNWQFSEELTEKISKLINKFDAVSVREKSGVDLCGKYLNVDAQCLVDPTMLLTREDYTRLIETQSENAPEGELLTYVLDWTKGKQSMIEYVASEKKLKPFEAGKATKNGYHSVESWLNGFKNAKFVITDSFHGTVFSILFNIPFITIANEGRGLTRFTSLLETFNLTNRLIFGLSDLKKTELEIDFSRVNKILESERKKSLQFFSTNLNIRQ